jgi:hypothetical protein
MLLKLPNGEYVPAEAMIWGTPGDGNVWGKVPGTTSPYVYLTSDDAAAMLRWLDAHSVDVTKPKSKPIQTNNKRLW